MQNKANRFGRNRSRDRNCQQFYHNWRSSRNNGCPEGEERSTRRHNKKPHSSSNGDRFNYRGKDYCTQSYRRGW